MACCPGPAQRRSYVETAMHEEDASPSAPGGRSQPPPTPPSSDRSDGAEAAVGGKEAATRFPTLADFGFDGLKALKHVIAGSTYDSLEQAIASLTLFSHPETVAQTGGKALFKIVRDAERRGTDGILDGLPVTYDDNAAPTHVFLWCNGIRRPKEVQFNHVHCESQNADLYTALPNICVTPAFLAKVTDTDPAIRSILAYRVYDLYGWVPEGRDAPHKPPGYRDLEWAPTLPVVLDVRAALHARIARAKRSRTALSVGRIGWLFAQQ